MPGGTQTIQLAGQNLQGLQVLPLSALQVNISCILYFLLIFLIFIICRVEEANKLLFSNHNKLKYYKLVMDKP